MRRLVILSGIFSLVCVMDARGGGGFDTAAAPDTAATWLGLDRAPVLSRDVCWLRIRGLTNAPVRAGEAASDAELDDEIAELRANLAVLRAAGYRSACMVRWSSDAWSAVRTGGGAGSRAPLDLRECHERARALAATYGDLVDAWEIENEPDIPFFADNADVFTAFYKALALGLAEGRGAGKTEGEKAPGRPRLAALEVALPMLRNPKARRAPLQFTPVSGSRVVMPAMGLPPGPYFAQTLENGLLSYTEGFNYHYYGFAMDYPGVYGQFRDGLGPRMVGAREATPGGFRRLPVFVTEWGYSLLDGREAQTVEGRVRQWRFFGQVARENERLRVAAPMAFLLPPYHEHEAKEFGLAMPPAERAAAHYGFPLEAGTGEGARGPFQAGGLAFAPGDFGTGSVEPWMRRIGERVGDAEASPALAWLLERAAARDGRASRDWPVRTEPPSPVVLDFIAGAGTQAVKTYHGYWLSGVREESGNGPGLAGKRARAGRGTLVAYNFSSQAAEVRLAWPAEMGPESEELATGCGALLQLRPGERREIPVVVRARADAFLPSEARLAGAVRCGGARTVARWASRFYAAPDNYVARERRDFFFPAEAGRANRARLLARAHAPEEPALNPAGRWLVSDGVRVEETTAGWRLHVERLPGVALRPAVAELPLPEGWTMPAGTVLSYDYRLVASPGAVELRADDPDPGRRRQTGRDGAIAESYIRTANGNLFSTVPRLSPKSDWRHYNQSAETFTMFFLGRTGLPWQFEKNEAAALVFFIRPTQLPAVFEVRDPQLARYGVAAQ